MHKTAWDCKDPNHSCNEETGAWVGNVLTTVNANTWQECCIGCRDQYSEDCRAWTMYQNGDCVMLQEVESGSNSGQGRTGIRGVIEDTTSNITAANQLTGPVIIQSVGAFTFSPCPGFEPEGMQLKSFGGSYQCSAAVLQCLAHFEIRYEDTSNSVYEVDTHYNLQGQMVGDPLVKDHCDDDACPGETFQRYIFRNFRDDDPAGHYDTKIEIHRDGASPDCFIATVDFEGISSRPCDAHEDCLHLLRYCTNQHVCSAMYYYSCLDIGDALDGECPPETYEFLEFAAPPSS